ncbi:MAG TPA: STAS domain-containing protein [Trebonia sp.]
METDRADVRPDGRAGPAELDPQQLDDLLSRVAHGDKAAFAEVYDQVAGVVYGLALTVTGDAVSSEEVTADVLNQIWRTAPHYDRAAGGVQDWVMTMTRQRALHQARPARGPGLRPVPAHSGCRAAWPGHPAVVTAPAELDLSTAEQLCIAVLAAFASGHETLVIDLTGSRFCDCAGLSALIRAHKRALAHGGESRLLVPADGAVSRLLAQTGLDCVLPHFTSMEDALGRKPLAAAG